MVFKQLNPRHSPVLIFHTCFVKDIHRVLPVVSQALLRQLDKLGNKFLIPEKCGAYGNRRPRRTMKSAIACDGLS